MKYASVCSGVEAASLAWMPLGWEAAWFSEIEPFPCAVLKERFPDVPNLGDMTKIKVETLSNGDQKFTGADGAVITVPGGVDLLVGGTPCQGFSVSGKMGGVNDLRSRLCLNYIDLLKTMRPRWFVWENVPGVFSTNGGGDFRQFLAKIDEIGYYLAWRVLDAQYVRVDGFPRAVPQRRRRVFVVGCLMGWTYPASVLFEPDCVSGNTPPRRIKGKGFAGDFETRAGTASVIRMRAGKPGGGKGALIGDELSHTLAAGANDQTLINSRPWDETGVNPTLNQCNAGSGIIGASNQEIFCQNANGLVMSIGNGQANSTKTDPELAQTLNTMHDQQAIIETGKGFFRESDCSGTLESNEDQHLRNIICAPLDLRNATRDPEKKDEINRQGVGIGQNGDPMTTLSTGAVPGVICVYGSQDSICNSDHANAVNRNNGLENIVCQYGEVAGTLEARHDSSPCADRGQNIVCYDARGNGDGTTANTMTGDHQSRITDYTALVQTYSLSSKNSKGFQSESPKGYCHEIDTARTLDTTPNDPNKNNGGNVVCSVHRTVRRLMPVECERLMGFPDNWTRIPWRGKPAEQCPDGPRYKACGNSMCVNVMRWIGMRIELVERKMKREEN